MAVPRQFEVVSDEPEVPQESLSEKAGTAALIMGLKALSQRAIAAVADLFMLATVGSAFCLWWATPKPDAYQIVSLSIYAVFVLCANYIVRSRRS